MINKLIIKVVISFLTETKLFRMLIQNTERFLRFLAKCVYGNSIGFVKSNWDETLTGFTKIGYSLINISAADKINTDPVLADCGPSRYGDSFQYNRLIPSLPVYWLVGGGVGSIAASPTPRTC